MEKLGRLKKQEVLLVSGLMTTAKQAIGAWAVDQVPLAQAFCIALSLHVVMLPVMWIVGWALPWPKYPIVTTIIEYDLQGWPNVAKPKSVIEVHDPDLNQ